MDIIYVVARVCFPVLFLVSGYGKAMSIASTAKLLAARGLPQPTAAAYAIAALEIVAGAMILVGFKTRAAALALLLFTAVATYGVHHFWDMSGADYAAHRIQALKNLSIMAALMMLIVQGSGRLSVDSRGA